ncbi:MAG: hypothetical protein PHS49_01745 [Candidatus Gracilibacteria bacterium]|nr:hypothetical protein [Candidatus Gracilibacteria bacterium]
MVVNKYFSDLPVKSQSNIVDAFDKIDLCKTPNMVERICEIRTKKADDFKYRLSVVKKQLKIEENFLDDYKGLLDMGLGNDMENRILEQERIISELSDRIIFLEGEIKKELLDD